jgi:uroporphyrinogen decarboxylase
MLDIVRSPELAVEVTLQPVRRYGVDAAILFSDIVVPLVGVGLDIELEAGTGPVVRDPFRSADDLGRLRPLEPDADIPFVLEAVRLLVKELGDVPLIGFAGGPFTLASYLIEGGPSKTYGRTKALMYGDPATWAALLDALAGIALASLRAQVEAGAAAVQLFDSWAGALSPADYARYVLPATARVFDGLADMGVPRIHFAVGAGELLELLAEAGADVVGVDWRVPLDAARARLGPAVAVQGNLDPARCLAPWPAVEEGVRDVLARNGGRPGHVFNLGWGVLPQTDPDVLRRIVGVVHNP